MIKRVFSIIFTLVLIYSSFGMAEKSDVIPAPAEQKEFTALQKRLISRSLELADKGQNQKALQILKTPILKNLNGGLDHNIQLIKGRVLFNSRKYSSALEAYEKIPRSSPLWLASVEERAWTKIYLGKMNDAIADSHTLMSPLFSDVVSPEAYYLSAFVSHQVCDFNRVFQIIEVFKKQSLGRIKEIEKKSKLNKSEKLNIELQHYSNVITHLHLIEADSIQRIYIDKKLAGKRPTLHNKTKNGEFDLEFPFEENDVWIDEVDQLKVEAKNCPVPFKKVASI